MVAALLIATSGCGDSETTTADPTASTTTTQAEQLVVERRAMSDDEYDRIDDNGEGGVLGCDDIGEAIWDYEPIDPDETDGRTAEDALADAIEDVNQNAQAEGFDPPLPRSGWIELTERPGRSTFVATDGTDWAALVVVLGDPDRGVWRHTSALICQP
jgi:hypothetical protein